LSAERAYSDALLKESKSVVTAMYNQMTKIHTKVKTTLVEVTKLSKTVSDLTLENKNQKSDGEVGAGCHRE
jgi:hypothetical protein